MIGQGLANLTSASLVAHAGSRTSRPTLVNIASRGKRGCRASSRGAFVLVAYLALGGLIAWAPIGRPRGHPDRGGVPHGGLEELPPAAPALDRPRFLVVATRSACGGGRGTDLRFGADGMRVAIMLFNRDR